MPISLSHREIFIVGDLDTRSKPVKGARGNWKMASVNGLEDGIGGRGRGV